MKKIALLNLGLLTLFTVFPSFTMEKKEQEQAHSTHNTDYYTILGVTRGASKENIANAYKKLSLQCHPDRHTNLGENEKAEKEAQFQKIATAAHVLLDDEKRTAYDKWGIRGVDSYEKNEQDYQLKKEFSDRLVTFEQSKSHLDYIGILNAKNAFLNSEYTAIKNKIQSLQGSITLPFLLARDHIADCLLSNYFTFALCKQARLSPTFITEILAYFPELSQNKYYKQLQELNQNYKAQQQPRSAPKPPSTPSTQTPQSQQTTDLKIFSDQCLSFYKACCNLPKTAENKAFRQDCLLTSCKKLKDIYAKYNNVSSDDLQSFLSLFEYIFAPNMFWDEDAAIIFCKILLQHIPTKFWAVQWAIHNDHRYNCNIHYFMKTLELIARKTARLKKETDVEFLNDAPDLQLFDKAMEDFNKKCKSIHNLMDGYQIKYLLKDICPLLLKILQKHGKNPIDLDLKYYDQFTNILNVIFQKSKFTPGNTKYYWCYRAEKDALKLCEELLQFELPFDRLATSSYFKEIYHKVTRQTASNSQGQKRPYATTTPGTSSTPSTPAKRARQELPTNPEEQKISTTFDEALTQFNNTIKEKYKSFDEKLDNELWNDIILMGKQLRGIFFNYDQNILLNIKAFHNFSLYFIRFFIKLCIQQDYDGAYALLFQINCVFPELPFEQLNDGVFIEKINSNFELTSIYALFVKFTQQRKDQLSVEQLKALFNDFFHCNVTPHCYRKKHQKIILLVYRILITELIGYKLYNEALNLVNKVLGFTWNQSMLQQQTSLLEARKFKDIFETQKITITDILNSDTDHMLDDILNTL